MKYFISIIIGAVALAVIGGFFIIGSPQRSRLRRFDERRVQDLQIMQSEIVNYWRMKNRLPESLDALRDDVRGFSAPKDPETSALYEYALKGPLSFELCATFNRASNEGATGMPKSVPVGFYGAENWEHGLGKICFTRTIDKDLYPPEKVRPATL